MLDVCNTLNHFGFFQIIFFAIIISITLGSLLYWFPCLKIIQEVKRKEKEKANRKEALSKIIIQKEIEEEIEQELKEEEEIKKNQKLN